jgi:MerR family copper efflux transcriptional regulator
MHGFSIGRLAKLANVSIDTIRYYEKAGLLAPHVRRPSGFREYSLDHLKQLRFIRRGRSLGFSLEEIKELLALDSSRDGATGVARHKLRIIQSKIQELERWSACLSEFIGDRATAQPVPYSLLDCFIDETAEAVAATHAARMRQDELRDRNEPN